MNPLSVIFVNYYAIDILLESIRSLYNKNPQIRFQVIVVDNGSDPAGKELVLYQFPELLWIPMGYNAGFARGNNRGMAAAVGDIFLLLNPDTVCTDDSVTRCFEKLQQSEFLAAGVQLIDANGVKQISGNYFVRGGLNHLLPIPYWGHFIRWLGYQTGNRVPGVDNAGSVQEVDWISGAFLMIKREAVKQAGGLDEDFFLYGEEVEWCSRLRKFGRLAIFGELSIIHLEGGSINKSQQLNEKGYYNLYDRKGLQLMVSNHLRVRKQYGALWFLFLLLNYTWGWLVFWTGSTLHRLFTFRNPAGDWSRAGRFGKNLLRLWALAPRILSNKPHFYKMF